MRHFTSIRLTRRWQTVRQFCCCLLQLKLAREGFSTNEGFSKSQSSHEPVKSAAWNDWRDCHKLLQSSKYSISFSHFIFVEDARDSLKITPKFQFARVFCWLILAVLITHLDHLRRLCKFGTKIGVRVRRPCTGSGPNQRAPTPKPYRRRKS